MNCILEIGRSFQYRNFIVCNALRRWTHWTKTTMQCKQKYQRCLLRDFSTQRKWVSYLCYAFYLYFTTVVLKHSFPFHAMKNCYFVGIGIWTDAFNFCICDSTREKCLLRDLVSRKVIHVHITCYVWTYYFHLTLWMIMKFISKINSDINQYCNSTIAIAINCRLQIFNKPGTGI